MSVTGLRAIIMTLNLALIGVVGLVCYDFFFANYETEFAVETPLLSLYRVEVNPDAGKQQKASYEVIKSLDRPPVKEAPEPGPAPPPPPPRNDPSQLSLIWAVYDPVDESRSSVWIKGPAAAEPKPFMAGDDLSVNTGFEGFKGWVVKAIPTQTTCILANSQLQKEHTLVKKETGAKP